MMTILTMIQSVRCVNSKQNKEGYFLLNLRSCPKVTGSDLGLQFGFFAPIYLDSSDRLLKLERIYIFTSILRNELRKPQWNPPSHDSQRTGSAATVGRYFLHHVVNTVDWNIGEGRPQESPSKSIRSYRRSCARHFGLKLQLTWRVTRIECCESIFLRLSEVTEKRYYLLIWKKFTSRDIWIKRKTRTTKLQQHDFGQNGEKRELFRQHRDLGHPQPTELARALRHAGVTLSNVRSTTSTAASPSRNVTTLSTFLTSALALVVCWGTGLQIVQPLWTSYTAKTVMKEFKIAWVKHYGWLEIIVHDQGPAFMGNEFQNPAGAAGVLTMPIDSQSPWQNGKQKGPESHSNINSGTWMKSVILKVKRSLKLQLPSVGTRETDIAIGQVFRHINACLVPVYVCLEAC